MASDIFLKLDGIPGESTTQGHENEIEILSFSWGLTQSGTSVGSGGGGAGKASFSDIHFTASVSKASPLLAKGCASGEHIASAVVSLRKAGSQPVDYLQIKMNDVLISGYSLAGADGGDRPEDAFSLNFAKVEFDYSPQKPDGSLDQVVKFTWDLRDNRGF